MRKSNEPIAGTGNPEAFRYKLIRSQILRL